MLSLSYKFAYGSLLIGAFLLAFLFNAWVLTHLWQWYAVPLSLPAITFAHAIGLMLLAELLVRSSNSENMPLEKWLLIKVLTATSILVIGYVLRQAI
jgi:hypothetical protein